ncbi:MULTISPECIES: hypothetical protein [unclassified Moraxella]
MTTKSLKEHGLIKTCLALIGLMLVLAMMIFVWKLPEIILAIKA